MSNILDPSALLSSLPSYLPSSKQLSSPQDALASLAHTILSVLGFRLVGVDESSSSENFDENVLPEDWNKHGPGLYTFRYKHEQSSLEYLVKALKLGNRNLINAIAIETEKTATLDISTDDFTSQSFFPYVVGSDGSRQLVHGYISSNRVADFASQFKLTIIQKLMPGLRKEGYTEEDSNLAPSSVITGQPSRPNIPPTSSPRPERPSDPPRFTPGSSHIPPENPLQIGRRDLDPLAAQHIPNPFAPPSLFPPNQGDGMYVGPNHPIFGGAFSPRGNPGNRRPWGGDGFLPPLGAPPGARFDPVGPGAFGPGGSPFGGFGGRGGREPLRRNGEPDNDEFMPPGINDMFS